MKKPITKDCTLYNVIYRKCLEQANLCRQKVHQWFPGAGGKKKEEMTTNWYEVSFGGDEKVQKLDNGDDCTSL